MTRSLLPATEIAEIISSEKPLVELAKTIRRGTWDAALLNTISEDIYASLETQTAPIYASQREEGLDELMTLLTIIFSAKDRFGFSTKSEEYLSLQGLFGSIAAAIGGYDASNTLLEFRGHNT